MNLHKDYECAPCARCFREYSTVGWSRLERGRLVSIIPNLHRSLISCLTSVLTRLDYKSKHNQEVDVNLSTEL